MKKEGSTPAFGRSVTSWPAEFETCIPLAVNVYWPLSGVKFQVRRQELKPVSY